MKKQLRDGLKRFSFKPEALIQVMADYDRWMRCINAMLSKLLGVSSDDLVDICWMDYFDDKLDPIKAIRAAIRDGLCEDYE
jgi:hypothetical protein